jgi:hypothetical protein
MCSSTWSWMRDSRMTLHLATADRASSRETKKCQLSLHYRVHKSDDLSLSNSSPSSWFASYRVARVKREEDGSRCASALPVSRISAIGAFVFPSLVATLFKAKRSDVLRYAGADIPAKILIGQPSSAISRYVVSVCRLPLRAWLHGERAFMRKSAQTRDKTVRAQLYTSVIRSRPSNDNEIYAGN